MYVSKLFVYQYRSLKDITITFKEGRNILVGKNNAGKSNVINALEILLGESSPINKTFDNNDFYCCEKEPSNKETGYSEYKEDQSTDFFICATLSGKDFDQDLIRSMKKNTQFSKIRSLKEVFGRDKNGLMKIDFDFFNNLTDTNFIKDRLEQNPYNNGWLTPNAIVELFNKAKQILIFFSKSKDKSDDLGNVGYGLVIILKDEVFISTFFPNKLRDSLVTTALIQAFRNPKDSLRLVHYTWYGKLIKHIWDIGKEDQISVGSESISIEDGIKIYSGKIRELADTIFKNHTSEITNLLIQAIAHKNVSFKLIDDKFDLYKNANIFINDGIDRPLQQKGSGIQSAIIIALFTTYCDNFHHASSLLIAEEPELFLHPQARRMLSSQFDKYLVSDDKRQLIISTHSTEFIKNASIKNIVVIRKDKTNNTSQVSQILNDKDLVEEELNKITKVIWSKNTEMFFADKVLLVEGGEEFLLPTIFDKISGEKNVLDYNNITIARVEGKGNFLVYAKILNYFKIPFVILGDLDCYKSDVRKFIDEFNIDIPDFNDFKQKISLVPDQRALKNTLTNKNSLDSEKIFRLFNKFKNREITVDDEDLHETISYIEDRIFKLDLSNKIESSHTLKTTFDNIQSSLRKENIFILSKGELEDYYSEEAKKLLQGFKSKDLKAMNLAELVARPEYTLPHLFKYPKELEDLYNILLGTINPESGFGGISES